MAYRLLPVELHAQAVALYLAGNNYTQIAQLLDVSPSTARRWIIRLDRVRQKARDIADPPKPNHMQRGFLARFLLRLLRIKR